MRSLLAALEIKPAHTVHFCRRILQCWKAYVWKRHRREIIF